MSYQMEIVKTKKQFDELYKQWAFTLQGLVLDGIPYVMKWLEENKAYNPQKDKTTVYVIKGNIMNEMYGLTGDNAYQDDVNIVCILGIDLNALVWARFEIGGKWFTDIVDNNRRREEVKELIAKQNN